MGSLELTGTLSPQALNGTERSLRQKEAFFTNYTRNLLMGGDIRVCSDVVFSRFLVRFCGNFYFKLWYCSFTKLGNL